MSRISKHARSRGEGHTVSRSALSLALSALLALGGIPSASLAEALDEIVVVEDAQSQDAGLSIQDEGAGLTVMDAESIEVVEEPGAEVWGAGDIEAVPDEPRVVEVDEAIVSEDEALGIQAIEEEPTVRVQESPSNYDASLYDSEGAYPGVYATKVQSNAAAPDAAATIRIPSIADSALVNVPTTESPAIICGTALPFADKENARAFQPCSARVAPYSYFKYSIMDQQATDGSTVKKLTGFDGTYVIVRIDLTELWNSVPAADRDSTFLHVSQNKNNALLVAVGMDTIAGSANVDGRDQWGNISFCNLFTEKGADGKATGTQWNRKTASYKLSEMYDTDGLDMKTPYLDVILFSTASIVSGADAQKESALNGDVELNLYFDKTADYDPATNWDPQSTDTELPAKCFAKFYDEAKAAAANATISRYLVKGSELHLETMVDKSDATGEKTTYWSLEKALEHAYYDQEIDKSKTDANCGRTITLMSEVPVINNLAIEGPSATELKKRTLNVNSFDVQVANNTSPKEGEYTSGLMLKNGWLKIADLSNTTGAELAIGNNATMTIETGGKLIVDETCQLEIEWDGATVAPETEGQPAQPTDILNNGSLDLRAGGEVQNDGVITIEGTEGKPYQPGTEQQASSAQKGHGELTICEGATFTNNGCFMPNGALYVQGTLVNNGKFDDSPIVSDDPDRGKFTYHRGIQCTWKDDVTQQNVIYGGMYVGMDKTWSKTYPNALVTNNGDIVLCPGELINLGQIKNMPYGGIYLCATDRAIVPIEPDPATPTITTKEVDLNEPVGSRIMNWGTINNQGEIRPAQVSVANNGSLVRLIMPSNYDELFVATSWLDKGAITGTGYIYKQSLQGADVEVRLKGTDQAIDSVAYDGTAKELEVDVIFEDPTQPGTNDFVVEYVNPNGETVTADKVKDAGTYKLLIRGRNAYKGTITKEFTITPATITEATLSEASMIYNGQEQKPTLASVKAGDVTLASTDYTVTYPSASPKDAGTYEVTVTGTGNAQGSKTLTYTIEPVPVEAVNVSETHFVANGSVQRPAVTSVKAGNLELAASDYTVTYSNDNPKDAGDYTLTVTGKGNAGGSKEVVFKIFDKTKEEPKGEGWYTFSDGGKGYVKDGSWVIGWLTLDSAKYYFGKDAHMLTGWNDINVGGKTMRYYFNPDSGNLARGTFMKIDGQTYYFRPSGNMATGFAQIDDKGVTKTYYFDAQGKMVTGWRDIVQGGKTVRYYFRPSGAMATGWATIEGSNYWFRPSGIMATGFTDVNDAYKRYFDERGKMLTGWQTINNNKYYFRASGAMQTGKATIDGVEYTFSDDGILQNA